MEFIPVVLVKRGIVLQVVAYYAIHDLSRSVGLWVMTGAHLELDSTVMLEVLPKFGCEFGVKIRDNGVWHAVEAKNMVEKAVGDVFGCVLASGRDQSHAFREPICKRGDAVVVILCQRKVFDKVHSNRVPSSGRELEWLRTTIRFLPSILIALACVTSAAIFFDV